MPPTRYLLYDAAESEGPSKQRMAGLYFLRRAMELDRVLVLPRCRLLARHRQRTRNHAAAIRLKGDDVYVPFSSLYNVSALATLHPVVELRDYLRTSPVIEKFAWRPPCNASNDDRRSVRFNGRLVRVRATQPCSCVVKTNSGSITSNKGTVETNYGTVACDCTGYSDKSDNILHNFGTITGYACDSCT